MTCAKGDVQRSVSMLHVSGEIIVICVQNFEHGTTLTEQGCGSRLSWWLSKCFEQQYSHHYEHARYVSINTYTTYDQ